MTLKNLIGHFWEILRSRLIILKMNKWKENIKHLFFFSNVFHI